jgi:hypothetical protein
MRRSPDTAVLRPPMPGCCATANWMTRWAWSLTSLRERLIKIKNEDGVGDVGPS